MPNPRAGESREDFLDRCIPEVVSEGRDPDQAVAMCLAYYEGEKDKAFDINKAGEVEYWKAFNNKRDSLEDRYTRSILKAFREQTSFIDNATTVQDLRGRIDPEPMVKAIEELYQNVGDSFARSTFSGLKKMVAPSFKQREDFIERMLTYVDYETIQKITDFSSELIQKAIIKGLEEGLDIRQIARQLRQQGMSSARARTIARTEIATASNGGSFEGALQSNVPFKKRWVAFNDGVTRGSDPRDRFNHLSQTINDVDKNEPFIVSGEQMMFPTDRKQGASVGNIVNCRCVTVYLTE
jgi:hypothetical protein